MVSPTTLYFSLLVVLLGIGAVPVYLAEMAPTSIQGALNMGFQMAITIGILMAGLVNYATAKIEGGYGWRLFLALAAVPSLLMTLAALFLPDTPNSILERGRPDETKEMLQKNPWHQRRGRRFTGIKVIMFMLHFFSTPWVLEKKLPSCLQSSLAVLTSSLP
ncbi:hypothetical protein ACFX14_000244 [Malus domestica]